MKTTRREFCALGAAALVGLSLKSDRAIAGEFVNDSFQMGHLLRDRRQFPAPRQIVRIPLVIAGGVGAETRMRLKRILGASLVIAVLAGGEEVAGRLAVAGLSVVGIEHRPVRPPGR